MKSISPNIFVKDINETIDFYKQLGFSLTTTVPEEGDLIFALMTCGNVKFMFQTFESLGDELTTISRQNGGSLLLYIQTNDITKFFDQIKDKVKVIKELEKTFYGATEFSIEDNNGYLLTFAEDEK
ncbi:MAG: VOC family protein [Bacteroidales bacterium]|nr:VOC family protein [Bacteroidales bacterium]